MTLEFFKLTCLKKGICTNNMDLNELHPVSYIKASQKPIPLTSSDNPKMAGIISRLKEVAPTRSTVLLSGETGVGKGLLARFIHAHSPRKNNEFVHVHCGAIPDNLLESELFGHERGAFTNAIKRKRGKFEQAHGGTIFLDEISTLTPSAQIKLLQVLQDACFQRVGGEQDIRVDIRVIAATNENLSELTEKARFRKDLFYRLNVFPLFIPSLRERPEDLEQLVMGFLEGLNKEYGKGIQGIDSNCLESLRSYSWPGNIRELQNVIERAYILETQNRLTSNSFPLEVLSSSNEKTLIPLYSQLPIKEARELALETFEVNYLEEVLRQNNGKINDAAEASGIGVRQLHKLMAKYKIEKKNYRR